MNPELKQKWLEALRSGKYKQGTGLLRSKENYFCCLGVLCDIIDNKKWEITNSGDYCYEKSTVAPTSSSIIREGAIGHLMTLNDEAKSSFAEIADWIEGNL